MQKSAQRRDTPRSRRPNIATLRERLNKLYLLEKLKKERENPILEVRNSLVELGFEKLEFGTKERRLEGRT